MLLDENLPWKEHLTYIETKCAENIGLLYKAKHHLKTKLLLALHYSYFHTYIKYANIAWSSTHNLKKLHGKLKYSISIEQNKAKFKHTWHFFRKNKILKVYQLNILNNAIILNNTAPSMFHPRFQKSSHSYPTNRSELNYLPTTWKK